MEIIDELIVSYWMEMETLQNYVAISRNLNGVRAEEIRKALAGDVPVELGHAERLATRIRVLGGQVPGSKAFKAMQHFLQPLIDNTNVVDVIKGVIQAENGAIGQYNKIIKFCDGVDYATQDLCIQILSDEEEHCREFRSFLTEYEGSKSVGPGSTEGCIRRLPEVCELE